MFVLVSSFSCFLLKLQFLCLFFLLFPFSNFDFTIYFYILGLNSVLQNKLGSLLFAKLGKLNLPQNFGGSQHSVIFPGNSPDRSWGPLFVVFLLLVKSSKSW